MKIIETAYPMTGTGYVQGIECSMEPTASNWVSCHSSMQRKLSFGTTWTDLVMAFSMGINPDSPVAYYPGNYGILFGFGSSDGNLLTEDQTIFAGMQKMSVNTAAWSRGSGDIYHYSNDVTKVVTMQSGSLTSLYSHTGYMSEYCNYPKTDGSYYSNGASLWYVVRLVKGGAGASEMWFTWNFHDYAARPSVVGMVGLLNTQDFNTLGNGLVGGAYSPKYLSRTGLTIPNEDLLDSVCIATTIQTAKFQILDVIVSKWA